MYEDRYVLCVFVMASFIEDFSEDRRLSNRADKPGECIITLVL